MTKNYIVIHHSATADGRILKDFDAILREHLARGYRDIGYHWVVEYVHGELAVIPGRAEWEIGAHCIGRNYDGIGICLVGNYENAPPTEEQYRFVAKLCREIMGRHSILEIGGHRHYDATACPGRYFDISYLRQLAKGDDDMLENVQVTVKDKIMAGKLIDGKVYVPVREIVETLNNVVIWDEKDRTVTIK